MVAVDRAHHLHALTLPVSIYESLLEGIPTREMNKEIIAKALAEERKKTWTGEPYLIPPRETPIEYPRGEYPFGEPAALPGTLCVAFFDCLERAKEANCDASCLSVIWFQDEVAFPIEPAVLEHIQAIDWKRYAFDYEKFC